MTEEVEIEATDKPDDKPEDKGPSVDELLAQREAHQEQLASERGWRPLETWVEEGNDPKDWRPAGEFNMVGEFAGKLKQKDREYKENLSGVQKIVEAQKKLLQTQRDQAIEDGNKDAVREIDSQIQELNTPAPQVDQTAAQWEERNPWIFDDSPKAVYAKARYGMYTQNGMASAEAIAKMEADVAKEFPTPKRPPPDSEKGKGSRGFKKTEAPITWDELSRDEHQLFQTGMWGDDKKAFLKAVQESRKGEQA